MCVLPAQADENLEELGDQADENLEDIDDTVAGKHQPCIKWALDGVCKNSDSCEFAHIQDGVFTPTSNVPVANVDDYILPGKIRCSWFAQGGCRRGDECLLLHENPQELDEDG